MKKKLLYLLLVGLLCSNTTVFAKTDENGNYYPDYFESYGQYKEDPHYYDADRVEERKIKNEEGDRILESLTKSRAGSSGYVYVKPIAQTTSSNCGPACVQMVLETVTGRSFNQSALASELYTSQATGTIIGNIPPVLNKYYPAGNWNAQTLSFRGLLSALQINCEKKQPMILNLNTAPLPGYGNRGYQHYVVGNGYKYWYFGGQGGNNVTYVDPYNLLSGTFGEHEVSLSTMENAMNANKGMYVW